MHCLLLVLRHGWTFTKLGCQQSYLALMDLHCGTLTVVSDTTSLVLYLLQEIHIHSGIVWNEIVNENGLPSCVQPYGPSRTHLT